MKTIVAALATLVAISHCSASAQPEFICVYFDEEGTTNCVEIVPPAEVTAYLLASTVEETAGISGWECSIEITEGVFVLAWNLRGNAVSGGWRLFSVGVQPPLPWASMIVLMDFVIAVGSSEPIYIWVGPYEYPSLPPPNTPVYASGNLGELRRLFPCTGLNDAGEQNPAACINCDCSEIVEAGGATWGGVKALYR